MNTTPPGKYVYKGFSNDIEEQLEEIHDNENKINDLLLKKITEFINENKVLTKTNKSSQIKLNNVKTSMKNAQRYLEFWKDYYRLLQLNNKNLLDKIPKNNDVDYSEKSPKHKRKLESKNNKSYFTIEGLLFI